MNVTTLIGLVGSNVEHLSRNFDGAVPDGVAPDHIAIAEDLLERMAQQVLPRPIRKPRGGRR